MPMPSSASAAGDGAGIAQVLVAVGDDHDPLGRVFGKRGLGQLQGRGEVGGVGAQIDSAFDHRRSMAMSSSNGGISIVGFAAKDDHAGLVLAALAVAVLAATSLIT